MCGHAFNNSGYSGHSVFNTKKTKKIIINFGKVEKAGKEKASDSPEGSIDDAWLPSPIPDGHLHLPLAQQSKKHHQGQFSAWL